MRLIKPEIVEKSLTVCVYTLRGATVAAILATVFGRPRMTQAGPLNDFYLASGDQMDIDVVFGSGVVRSWSQSGNEYPIVAVNNVVRTTDRGAGIGAEYTSTGTLIAATTGHSAGGRHFDGSTDGTSNYSWDFDGGVAYRHNADWSGSSILFSLGNSQGERLAITYDNVNNSLWIAGWSGSIGSTIENYSLGGTLLSSFAVPVSEIAGLGMDYTDNTLWFGTQNDLDITRTLYQFSRTGTALSTDTYAALAGQNFLGGEFDFAVVPEPSSFLLLVVGLTALMVVQQRRRT